MENPLGKQRTWERENDQMDMYEDIFCKIPYRNLRSVFSLRCNDQRHDRICIRNRIDFCIVNKSKQHVRFPLMTLWKRQDYRNSESILVSNNLKLQNEEEVKYRLCRVVNSYCQCVTLCIVQNHWAKNAQWGDSGDCLNGRKTWSIGGMPSAIILPTIHS